MKTNVSQVWSVFVCGVLIVAFLAPLEIESRRVIFMAPLRMDVFVGQILSTMAKEKPCGHCKMRDHRGNCRRVLAFNSGGIKC